MTFLTDVPHEHVLGSIVVEKGRLVHIVGRVEYREWTDAESGNKRHAYDVIAENVEFLGGKPGAGQGDQSPEQQPQQATA